jgi:hypothetical protein
MTYESGEPWWDDIEWGNWRTKENCNSATLSSANPKSTDSGSNVRLLGEHLATNCLSHGTGLYDLKNVLYHHAHTDLYYEFLAVDLCSCMTDCSVYTRSALGHSWN